MQRQGLIDELRLFQAMMVLGEVLARPVFAGRGSTAMSDCWEFRLAEQGFFGTDMYLRLRPKE